MSDDAMRVFDRALLRARRDRAARCDTADFLFAEVAERIADRLADVARGFPRVLECGARRGTLSRRLAGRFGIETLLACELSPAMAAQNDAAAHRLVADEELLPVAEGAFDLAVSALALHWVNDLPGALVQIRRALRPDGLFLAAFLGGDTLIELRRALIEAEAEITGGAARRTSPTVPLDVAAGLLQRAGFALPVADRDTLTVTYPDAFALIRDLRAMGEASALAERDGRGLRRDVLLAAAERYRALFGDGTGRVPATFELIWLTAWAPAESQPKPLRPGSAAARLAEVLDTVERPAGDKADPGP